MKKPLTTGHRTMPATHPRGSRKFGDRLRLVAGVGINVAGATVLLVEALWHSGLSV